MTTEPKELTPAEFAEIEAREVKFWDDLANRRRASMANAAWDRQSLLSHIAALKAKHAAEIEAVQGELAEARQHLSGRELQ